MLVPVVLYFAGFAAFAIGSTVYVLPLIFGVWLLTRSSLEERVEEQVDELERLSRLRRFLSPQVADAVVSSGSESFLAAHRREIAVFFCDLRGFTAFSSSVEPEEVVEVLNEYYEVIGEQLHKFEATVGAFAGDGIMAYLNDPNPCDDPGWRAGPSGEPAADGHDAEGLRPPRPGLQGSRLVRLRPQRRRHRATARCR